MINEIFAVVNKIKFGIDGDVVDRLHHKYTVFLLIFLALFLTTESLTGEKIKCFTQVVYPKAWTNYIARMCWVKNTYQVDFDESPKTAERHEVVYYQWAAIILALSSVCFYLPCKLWHYFAERAGINIDNMIETCTDFTLCVNEEKRSGLFVNLAQFLDRFFDAQALKAKRSTSILTRICSCFSRSSGSYLGFGYILVKCCYLLNVVAQFFIMTKFLGASTQFHSFGFSVTKLVTQGMVWEDSHVFPRVVLCDFAIRELGDVHREETVQCLLPQNVYMEKAFIIVWWWYVMLILATSLNLLQWIIRVCTNTDNDLFVKQYLRAVEQYPITREEAVKKGLKKKLGYFVKFYLMQDGVFVLKLISKNVSALMMSQIVAEIWKHFLDNYDEEMKQRGIDDSPVDDEAALVGPDETPEEDDDEDDGRKNPMPNYPEHGTLEGDRKPSAPQLYDQLKK